jgi:hypothetical protein
MSKHNQLNSARIMEAVANPTPDNKFLRDMYRFTYPIHNRLHSNAEKFQSQLAERFSGSIVPYHGSHYHGIRTPMKFFCMDCRHSWTATPESMVRTSNGCSQCGEKPPKRSPARTTPEEQEYLRSLVDQGLSFSTITSLTGRSYGTVKAAVDAGFREHRKTYARDYYRSKGV